MLKMSSRRLVAVVLSCPALVCAFAVWGVVSLALRAQPVSATAPAYTAYPTLLPIARAKNTLTGHYLAEEANGRN